MFWLITWLLVFPFFHVHPEADHHHVDPGHVHGSTVHTVFSPDPNCEVSAFDHASVPGKESPCLLHLVAHPSHGFEQPEIDFVLASSAGPQVGKGTALDAAAHSFHANMPARPRAAWQPESSQSLTDLLLTLNLSSRGPPIAS